MCLLHVGPLSSFRYLIWPLLQESFIFTIFTSCKTIFMFIILSKFSSSKASCFAKFFLLPPGRWSRRNGLPTQRGALRRCVWGKIVGRKISENFHTCVPLWKLREDENEKTKKTKTRRFNHENDVLSWENWEAGASLLALGSASVGTSARTPSGFFRSQEVCWFVSLFCTFKSFDYKKNYSDSYFFKVFLKHSFFK